MSSPIWPRMDVSTAVEHWPFKRPFRIAGHVFDGIDVLVVTVRSGGVHGRGEASGVFYHGETARGMAAQIDSLSTGTDHDGLVRRLIARWRDDQGATYRSWFLWDERLKNFRSIRRGITQVVGEIERGTFGVAYRGSSLETVVHSVAATGDFEQFLATLAVDVHVHDTYFVVAHFHYIMVGGAVMGYLGGIHFWWPKITGRMYPTAWGNFAAILIFAGFNLTFFPQFLLGYLGMPRRYHAYPPEWQVLNVMSSAGASILGIGYLLPLGYLLWSLRYGAVAGNNPWHATGLEWTTQSPPITHNFEQTPIVTSEPYDYQPEDKAAPMTVAELERAAT